MSWSLCHPLRTVLKGPHYAIANERVTQPLFHAGHEAKRVGADVDRKVELTHATQLVFLEKREFSSQRRDTVVRNADDLFAPPHCLGRRHEPVNTPLKIQSIRGLIYKLYCRPRIIVGVQGQSFLVVLFFDPTGRNHQLDTFIVSMYGLHQ